MKTISASLMAARLTWPYKLADSSQGKASSGKLQVSVCWSNTVPGVEGQFRKTNTAERPAPTFSTDEAVLVHPVQSSVIVVDRVADVENLNNISELGFFFVKSIFMEILG